MMNEKIAKLKSYSIHCSTLAIDASLQVSWKFVSWFREEGF